MPTIAEMGIKGAAPLAHVPLGEGGGSSSLLGDEQLGLLVVGGQGVCPAW